MRIQVVNETRHDFKIDFFNIDEKTSHKDHIDKKCDESHCSHHSENSTSHDSSDCNHKHHHIHNDYLKLENHFDSHHHKSHHHKDYCEVHFCHANKCKHHHVHSDKLTCKVHNCHEDKCKHYHVMYCDLHKCHYDKCKHHHEKHCNEKNCEEEKTNDHHVRRVRGNKDKSFDIDFGTVIYVKNREKKITAVFGFDRKGHLFYHKCTGVKCEIVKTRKHIQLIFNKDC